MTRQEMKMMAKQTLYGNFGILVVGMLLSGLLGLLAALPYLTMNIMKSIFPEFSRSMGWRFGFFFLYGGYQCVALLLQVGMIRMVFQVCVTGKTQIREMFFAFCNNPFRFLGLQISLNVFYLISILPGAVLLVIGVLFGTILGTLLVLFGSAVILVLLIRVNLRYMPALFLLVEEPNYRIGEVFRYSKEMMSHYMKPLFDLKLSFVGMHLLGIITLGIGYFWLTPYILCTNLYFYFQIKAKTYPSQGARELGFLE